MQTGLSLSTVTATQEQVDTLLRELLPAQGQWSEAAYLWLTDHTSRLIEFTDGYLEVLPMPTDEHQTMLLLLYELLVAFVRPRGGTVLVAPLRLKIRDGTYREPDIVVVRSARAPRRQNRFWLGAALVVEVVSPDKPERDLVDKRSAYAEVQIPEYWMVSPQSETIAVLCLEGRTYV